MKTTFMKTWEIATIAISSAGTGYTNSQTGAAVTTVTGLYAQASVVPVLTVNTNGTGNVSAVNITGSSRGEFTSIDGTGITTWGVVGAGGSNAQITVTFRIKSIAITEQGSGYVSVPSLSWSQVNGGTMPSAQTPSLTTDSGAVGSSTYQENSIIAYAYTGGSLVEVDIQKQKSAKRYVVNKSGEVSRTGTEVARIRYDAEADGTAGYTADEGVELNIVAIDSAGGTYLVRKLTNHTCTLSPQAITRLSSSAGSQFTAGIQVPWTFGTPTVNYSVQIENA